MEAKDLWSRAERFNGRYCMDCGEPTPGPDYRRCDPCMANIGARVADDCACPSCGRRGYRGLCGACR